MEAGSSVGTPCPLTMPTVFRSGPYRFFFYSADRAEPSHVHVERGNSVAKLWLDPVRLGASRGFGAPELRQLEKLVRLNETFLLRAWHDFFSD